MTQDTLATLVAPFVAGNISLLFALMSRNAMVSQRIREATREIYSPTCTGERCDCLKRQVEAFLVRYASNKRAIVSTLASVGAFIAGIALQSVEWRLTEGFVWLSLALFLFSIVSTAVDFLVATRTLEIEVDHALRGHRRTLAEP